MANYTGGFEVSCKRAVPKIALEPAPLPSRLRRRHNLRKPGQCVRCGVQPSHARLAHGRCVVRAGYVFCLSYLVACGFSMCIQVLVEPLRVGETSSESALSLPKIGRLLGRIYGVATAPGAGRSGVPVRSSSGQR